MYGRVGVYVVVLLQFICVLYLGVAPFGLSSDLPMCFALLLRVCVDSRDKQDNDDSAGYAGHAGGRSRGECMVRPYCSFFKYKELFFNS